MKLEPLSSQEAYTEARGVQKIFPCADIQAHSLRCPDMLWSLHPWRFTAPQ